MIQEGGIRTDVTYLRAVATYRYITGSTRVACTKDNHIVGKIGLRDQSHAQPTVLRTEDSSFLEQLARSESTKCGCG